MKKIFASVMLVAFLAVAGAGYAQDAAKSTDTTTKTAKTPAKKTGKAKAKTPAKKGAAKKADSSTTPPPAK